jgi:AmmeMemoRadiSam system protein A
MPARLPSRSRSGAARPDSVSPLDDERREQLLEVARAALAVATGSADRKRLDAAMEAARSLEMPAAAFVTLTEAGELRGCMGRLDPDRPVIVSVAEAAICAAVEDPRFEPVRADELDRIRIEVSILGPYQPLADPEGFEPGVEGILVERGWQRGLLLPEAAAECGLGRREVLEITCRKAGLATEAWRDPRTVVFAFRTVRFGGPARPAPGVAGATELALLR